MTDPEHAVKPPAATGPVSEPASDLADAAARLTALTSRVDGTAYLSGWSVRQLRELAASLGLRGVGGLRKAELVDRIVDHTIGYRLASTALRQR